MSETEGYENYPQAMLDSSSDKYGRTILSFHAEKGNKLWVDYLLEKGADTNIQDKEGQTALYKATKNGHKDIVVALLEHGAKVNIPDNKGLTGFYWVWGHSTIPNQTTPKDKPFAEIVEILKKHGAELPKIEISK